MNHQTVWSRSVFLEGVYRLFDPPANNTVYQVKLDAQRETMALREILVTEVLTAVNGDGE